MEKKNDKYPFFRSIDETYGFKPGTYYIPTMSKVPDYYEEGAPKIVIQEFNSFWTGESLPGQGLIKQWFYFDGKWVEINHETLLNPLNLRLRREFCEELGRLKECPHPNK